MTAAMTQGAARTLTDWLEELLSVDPIGQGVVVIEGLGAQLKDRRVRCNVHDVTLKWIELAQHLERSETPHRREHGPGARLHQVGDLVPASVGDDAAARVWPSTRCRRPRCGAAIVWAVTPGGKRMPVDAEPEPNGNVVLSPQPGSTSYSDPPLATVLHTDGERAEVPAVRRHVAHFATCKGQR